MTSHRNAFPPRSTANPGKPALFARLARPAGLALSIGLGLFWWFGGLQAIELWAVQGQRDAQNNMALLLRQLKAGSPGAFFALMALAFGYGVFHAAGPGHGKVLIGSYGMGTGIRLAPLVAIALASSLAQATTAVALVYAGVRVFEWTREQMVGAAEAVMAPLSYAAIGLIGLWLVWRGIRGLWPGHRVPAGDAASLTPDPHKRAPLTPDPPAPMAAQDHYADTHAPHLHHHTDQAGHAHCGHRHGPSVVEIARAKTLRDAVVLIGGVAIRPCSGALFLLIITWRMGIGGAGIAGAYVMALGTAIVTIAVAVLAVTARGGLLAGGERLGAVRALLPVLELGAGLVVVFAAGHLLMPFL